MSRQKVWCKAGFGGFAKHVVFFLHTILYAYKCDCFLVISVDFSSQLATCFVRVICACCTHLLMMRCIVLQVPPTVIVGYMMFVIILSEDNCEDGV